VTFRRHQIRMLRAAKIRAEWREQVITETAERGIRQIEQHLKEAAR
jgi:hypothetical protein